MVVEEKFVDLWDIPQVLFCQGMPEFLRIFVLLLGDMISGASPCLVINVCHSMVLPHRLMHKLWQMGQLEKVFFETKERLESWKHAKPQPISHT